MWKKEKAFEVWKTHLQCEKDWTHPYWSEGGRGSPMKNAGGLLDLRETSAPPPARKRGPQLCSCCKLDSPTILNEVESGVFPRASREVHSPAHTLNLT